MPLKKKFVIMRINLSLICAIFVSDFVLMKCTGSIFLILLIITQTFGPHLMIVAFRMNQQQIAKTYCVNKTRPRMHCNGKCYLAKQLAKLNQNDTEKNPSDELTFNLKMQPFTAHFVTASSISGDASQLFHWGLPTQDYFPSPENRSVFHPPASIA